ncbi:hypothetical protein ABR36_10220 [Enterobacter ludwigii]|nr:hypothetical protein ABR36_10220 [Enterobacter ludwigii]
MALPSAIATHEKWKVPVSVLLAQSGLESGWGRQVKNNAYFGIKGKSASGEIASFTTHEYENGHYVSKTQSFRAYHDYGESADDYGRFLFENKRYKLAFSFATEPNRFVCEIAKAGYATDPSYENKLIKVMSGYDLYEYD